MDVATVTAWSAFAGPALTLAGVQVRARARVRHQREQHALIVALVSGLPAGGRLVCWREVDSGLNVLVAVCQDK
jgi:hypothetical protein